MTPSLPFANKTDYKVIVAGSRSIEDPEIVEAAIERSGYNIGEVVTGTCYGPDTFGESWAMKQDIDVRRMPASWDNHGKKAGIVRNKKMATYADALIACWDGKSTGTEQMIDYAHGRKMPVFVTVVGDGDYTNRYYEMALNKIPT